MNIKTKFALAVGIMGALSTVSAHAFTLNNGDVLTIESGVPSYDSNDNQMNVTGSWFAIDTNDDHAINSGTEKFTLSEGNTGLIIGTATPAGASHAGSPTAGDTNAITAPWSFLGNTGSDYTTVGITGDTVNGLNMSGWTVTWNGIPSIPLGSGAWTLLNAGAAGMAAGPYTNGVGKFSWNGVYGSTYTLDYLATVPLGHPSGFGGVKYALHLEGVTAVPEASTYGMMLAGLGLVGLAAARRRKQSEV